MTEVVEVTEAGEAAEEVEVAEVAFVKKKHTIGNAAGPTPRLIRQKGSRPSTAKTIRKIVRKILT
jgi:hypothetical protein